MTTAEPPTLARYRNGNVDVTLLGDGSLTREWEGVARPIHPCSIDLKITDYCDAGCAFCHESSTKRGQHASLDTIERIVEDLPAGVEIAIGGGNPLDYPWLSTLLNKLSLRGLVANITVHETHFTKHWQRILRLSKSGLVHGVGVSTTDPSAIKILPQLCYVPNLVFHVIAGLTNPQPLISCRAERVLVLGYKQFGRGIRHHSGKVEENLNRWRYWLPSLLANSRLVSFDNLAIEQLGLREIVKPEAWSAGYMGGDGEFTMYVDAVRDEYAVSSTSERVPMNGKTAREAFVEMRGARREEV